MNNKQKILIVDDSEMNRSILADILEDKYDIIETEDGVEGVAAIQKYGTKFPWCFVDVVYAQNGRLRRAGFDESAPLD